MMVLMAIVVNGYGRDCGGEKGASDIGADEDGCVSTNNCGGDCGWVVIEGVRTVGIRGMLVKLIFLGTVVGVVVDGTS